MAKRFCGHGFVTIKFEDRSNTYRCTVDDGEGGQGRVSVGLSGRLDKAVDSPEAYDEVAGAAISFACDDRTVSSDRFESDNRGWVIRRKK